METSGIFSISITITPLGPLDSDVAMSAEVVVIGIPINTLCLLRLGILDDTLVKILDLSRIIPASTKNSLAEGSKLSKLKE